MAQNDKLKNFNFATGQNAAYLESLYEQYQQDPNSVDPLMQKFFEGYELAQAGAGITFKGPGAGTSSSAVGAGGSDAAKVEAYINAYRRLGHLNSHLNPLLDEADRLADISPERHGLTTVKDTDVFEPANLPKKQMTFKEIRDLMEKTYCRFIGADFRDIDTIEEVVWFQEKMEGCENEPTFSKEEKLRIHDQLMVAEGFEKFLQDRYLGQKRFSVEGTDALIPLLDFLADTSAQTGAEEINLGMAHRGRLNVLANFMQKDYELLLKEFEGTEFNPFDIDGDVKYHLGFASEVKTFSGKDMRLFLCPNPSHLEAVNPVVEGIARGRQDSLDDTERKKVVPVLLHGDAAFIGQGVVAETLNLSELEDYRTGGTIHVITNNQVGFTADQEEGRSCEYSSDIAKMLRAPVLHVNADHPEAVAWSARLAAEYRQKFHKDIVIDLYGYRRHGHNETDEPGFTQPLMYKKIKAHKTCLTQYVEKLDQEGVQSKDVSKTKLKEFRAKLQAAMEKVRAGEKITDPVYPKEFQEIMVSPKIAREDLVKPVNTTVSKKNLETIGKKLCDIDASFTAHPKIKKLFAGREEMMKGTGKMDWGMGELLAYGSLLSEGHGVRLSGQDCRRGTFSHRHAVLTDFENNSKLHILNNAAEKGAFATVINSPLSEAGVMGFEFGYSVARRNDLVLWEAQFGDFVNGAQIIIDQFLSASAAKWKQTCNLVLLLPHGYEGMGPEHSSARLERFLQLCGSLNMSVINPTKPAQLFHALRRQALRHFKTPLVVMTPKSLLRHPLVVSTWDEFTKGQFSEFIDDTHVEDPESVKRVILCSGKIYYDLTAEREKNEIGKDTAIVRLEQLYPFPEGLDTEVISRYRNATEVVWAQEEPQNMGSWYYVRHRLEQLLENRIAIKYIGRKGSGTTAEGSGKAHAQEQNRIVTEALTTQTTNGGGEEVKIASITDARRNSAAN